MRAGTEQLLRTYIQAKDENRPHLLAQVFSDRACLQIIRYVSRRRESSPTWARKDRHDAISV
jgi:hypothetical protein